MSKTTKNTQVYWNKDNYITPDGQKHLREILKRFDALNKELKAFGASSEAKDIAAELQNVREQYLGRIPKEGDENYVK